jgi:hypothetical protein
MSKPAQTYRVFQGTDLHPAASPVLAVEQPRTVGGEYAMIKSGPAVDADEVELGHVEAIEVLVKWGTNVLHVAHLSPARSFFVGESDVKGGACDFLLPRDVLGAERVPVVVARGGRGWLVTPRGAVGTVAMPNEASQSLAEFVSTGRARPSSEANGAHEIELVPGARATFELPGVGISFEVSAVNAGRKIAAGLLPTLESSAMKQIGLSVVAHLGIVASLAFFMPRMATDDAENIDRDYMTRMLHAADARAMAEPMAQEAPAPSDDGASGGEGIRAAGAEGKMGSAVSTARDRHYTVAGPREENPDPRLAREHALDEAIHSPLVVLLKRSAWVDTAPIAAWGADTELGRDAENHLGSMWGAEAGDAWGTGGLGLTGNEEGGGGKGAGIGLDGVATVGHGGGCVAAPGRPCGLGIGPGGEGISHGYHPGGVHTPRGPSMVNSVTTVNGRLPAEVIQRIVRQNFGRFRSCYESALRTNPSVQGRVAVKFVIGRDGAVMMASDGGSDLPDQGVIACVTRGFQNLSFPQPQDGVVTVVYPLVFTPAD